MELAKRPPRLKTEARLDSLRLAHDKAADEIRGSRDPDQRYAEATLLLDVLHGLQTVGGEIRAQAAREIMDQHKFSLAELGQHLGISKAMADRLIRRTRS